MFLSARRLRFFLVVLALLFGPAGSSAIATSKTPSPVATYTSIESGQADGFVILAGPQGQQVAIYCRQSDVVFAAQLAPPQAVLILGARAGLSCSSANLDKLFPGSKPVVNASPREGWVVADNVASRCQGSTLVKVQGGQSNNPLVKLDRGAPTCAVPI